MSIYSGLGSWSDEVVRCDAALGEQVIEQQLHAANSRAGQRRSAWENRMNKLTPKRF
jgi:hypothetical protein